MSALRPTGPRTGIRIVFALGSAAGAAALLLSATGHPTMQAQAEPGGQSAAPPPTRSSPTASPSTGDGRGVGAPPANSPTELTAALLSAVPLDGTDPRISGVYGSGHHGTWQFTAFITWRTSSGDVQGGRVDLPTDDGHATSPTDLGYDDDRLHREHDIGWTSQRLGDTLGQVPAEDALAMLELQIPDSGTATFTACAARNTVEPATCESATDGQAPQRVRSALIDQPGNGAIAVQRQQG